MISVLPSDAATTHRPLMRTGYITSSGLDSHSHSVGFFCLNKTFKLRISSDCIVYVEDPAEGMTLWNLWGLAGFISQAFLLNVSRSAASAHVAQAQTSDTSLRLKKKQGQGVVVFTSNQLGHQKNWMNNCLLWLPFIKGKYILVILLIKFVSPSQCSYEDWERTQKRSI